MPNNDAPARYLRRIASPTLTPSNVEGGGEVCIDSDTAELKFYSRGATRTVMDEHNAQTVTGPKTYSGAAAFSGGVTISTLPISGPSQRPVTVGSTSTYALAVADSGRVYVATLSSATQTYTLPAAATAGLWFTFVCAHASSEIIVAVATGDNIIGKTHGANDGTGLLSTATTGVLKNTAATNVVGDFTTLVSDGITTWYMVAVAGVWSVT